MRAALEGTPDRLNMPMALHKRAVAPVVAPPVMLPFERSLTMKLHAAPSNEARTRPPPRSNNDNDLGREKRRNTTESASAITGTSSSHHHSASPGKTRKREGHSKRSEQKAVSGSAGKISKEKEKTGSGRDSRKSEQKRKLEHSSSRTPRNSDSSSKADSSVLFQRSKSSKLHYSPSKKPEAGGSGPTVKSSSGPDSHALRSAKSRKEGEGALKETAETADGAGGVSRLKHSQSMFKPQTSSKRVSEVRGRDVVEEESKRIHSNASELGMVTTPASRKPGDLEQPKTTRTTPLNKKSHGTAAHHQATVAHSAHAANSAQPLPSSLVKSVSTAKSATTTSPGNLSAQRTVDQVGSARTTGNSKLTVTAFNSTTPVPRAKSARASKVEESALYSSVLQRMHSLMNDSGVRGSLSLQSTSLAQKALHRGDSLAVYSTSPKTPFERATSELFHAPLQRALHSPKGVPGAPLNRPTNALEANLHERIATLSLLNDCINEVRALLVEKDARASKLNMLLREKTEDWASRDENVRSNPQAVHKLFRWVDGVTQELTRQRRIVEELRPGLNVLANDVQIQKALLRKQIQRTGGQLCGLISDRHALLAELGNIRPAGLLHEDWDAPKVLDPELLRQRKTALMQSVTDFELRDFLETNPGHIHTLVQYVRTPFLLEALQFDGVSLSYSGLGRNETDRQSGGFAGDSSPISSSPALGTLTTPSRDLISQRSSPNSAQLTGSILHFISSWIEYNVYFYRLALTDCDISPAAWERLADRLSRIDRVSELVFSHCTLTAEVLKVILKGVRRNPVVVLDLSYNKLGPAGVKLVHKALVKPLRTQAGSTSTTTRDRVSTSGPVVRFDSLESGAQDSPSLSRKIRNESNFGAAPDSPLMCGTPTVVLNGDSLGPIEGTFPIGRIGGASGTLSFEQADSRGAAEKTGTNRAVLTSLSQEGQPKEAAPASIPKAGVLGACPPMFSASLRELNLAVNNLKDAGAAHVAAILRSRAAPNLRILDLRWNDIGVEGAAAIASALQSLSQPAASNTVAGSLVGTYLGNVPASVEPGSTASRQSAYVTARGGGSPLMIHPSEEETEATNNNETLLLTDTVMLDSSFNPEAAKDVDDVAGSARAGALESEALQHQGHQAAEDSSVYVPLDTLNLAGNQIGSAGAASLLLSLGMSSDVVVRDLNLSMNHVDNSVLPSVLSMVTSFETHKSHTLNEIFVNFEWNEITDSSGVLQIIDAVVALPPRSNLSDSNPLAQTHSAPMARTGMGELQTAAAIVPGSSLVDLFPAAQKAVLSFKNNELCLPVSPEEVCRLTDGRVAV